MQGTLIYLFLTNQTGLHARFNYRLKKACNWQPGSLPQGKKYRHR